MKKLIFTLMTLLMFSSISYANEDLILIGSKKKDNLYLIKSSILDVGSYKEVSLLFIGNKARIAVFTYLYDCKNIRHRLVHRYTTGSYKKYDSKWESFKVSSPFGYVFDIVCSK